MFTGIVEDVGTIVRIFTGSGGGKTLWIRTNLDPASIQIGDSIATQGVCLTATQIDGATFSVDAGPETLGRTTIGMLRAGAKVNLERSVTAQTRLGGHLVQGHADAVGRVSSIQQRENAWDLEVEAPSEVLRLIIARGSVAVDGISLTVTGRTAQSFSISIIPHTWKVTAMAGLSVGSSVNLEVDLIARYVEGLLTSFLAEGQTAPVPSKITEAFLKEHGFG